MDKGTAVAEVLEAISASALVMAAELRRAADPGSGDGDSLPDPIDPLGEQATFCLEGLTGVAGMEARLAAVKVQLATGYVTADAAMAVPAASPQDLMVRRMAVRAEVAGALTISEGAAERLLVESGMLSTELPVTLAALQRGRISWQHARILCDETEGLSPEAAAAFEAHFLDPDAPNAARGCFAGELAPARFRAKARYWRERHHQDSIEARHAKSVKDRRLEYQPDRDGMAWLSAYLPADQAAGIWNRTTSTARGLQGPNEKRTLSQLRADVFSTWLLTPSRGARAIDGTGGAPARSGHANSRPAGSPPAGSPPAGSVPNVGLRTGDVTAGSVLAGDVLAGSVLAGDVLAGGPLAGDVPSPQALVLVTVPVFSLLGHTDEPATLDGYGPIPASMARRLVADGATSFHRVLTDPRDGAPLEIGRTSYRLTKPMRQWIRLRDAKCTFPGCNNHSLDNDADHILAWADGGGTGVANLGQPCPKHHRLKHTTAWRPVGATRDRPPGWISPSGRYFPAEYQDWEPPTWPESPAGQVESGAPAAQALPEPPGQDCPEPPDWFDAPPDQDLPVSRVCPEPPGWFEAPPNDDWPVPPGWRDPTDQPDDFDSFGGADTGPGLPGYGGPESSEAPDDAASVQRLPAVYGLGLPLPADPWPDWQSWTAA